ncbi:DUF1540 domain-containing protein [Natronospora cellulosivora (SeqCode)]
MANTITCDVENCVYNKEKSCEREEIRVLSNTPETTGNETISCMSFRASQSKEANAKPELAETHV